MELKLTNVAKASLEELRLDYEDFLRQRGLALWAPSDPRRKALVTRRCATADEVALWVKEYGLDGPDGQHGPTAPDGPNETKATTKSSMESIKSMPSNYSGAAANAALVLIGVAVALLDRQVKALAAAFEQQGGFTERLYRTRQQRRRQP